MTEGSEDLHDLLEAYTTDGEVDYRTPRGHDSRGIKSTFFEFGGPGRLVSASQPVYLFGQGSSRGGSRLR